MASDIFSVQPPAWLTEISTGDVTKHERESYALGQHDRALNIQQQHYANEEKLTGLRAQALMLQSEARIRALQNANDSAALRIQMQEGQLKLAQAKFEQTSQAMAMKETMTSDFQQQLASIEDPELRTKIVEKNPNFIRDGVSTDQWADIKAHNAEKLRANEAQMLERGMTADRVTVKTPEGTTVFKAPEGNDQPEFINVGERQFMRWGKYKWDLSTVGTADKVELDLAKHRIDRIEKAIIDNPKDTGLKRQANLARYDLERLLKRTKLPSTQFDPASAAPVSTAPAPVPSTNMIRVRSKDGITGTIPASQVEDAKKQGYQVLE